MSTKMYTFQYEKFQLDLSLVILTICIETGDMWLRILSI